MNEGSKLSNIRSSESGSAPPVPHSGETGRPEQKVWNGAAEILPLFAGALCLFLATPPFDLFYLAYPAFGIALLSVRRGARGFLKGFLFGIAVNLSTMYWIVHVLTVYGNISIGVALALFLLLAAYLSLYPALFFKAFETWFRLLNGPLLVVLGSAAWVLMEMLRAHLMTGFPWMLLGYTQHSFLPVVQVAKVGGVYGVSFLVMFINLSLFTLLRYGTGKRRSDLVPAVTAVLLFCSAVLWGGRNIDSLKQQFSRKKPLDVLLVQANIDQSQKWEKGLQKKIMAKHLSLSAEREPGESSPLVIWPETALPFIYGLDSQATEYFKELTADQDFYLITGFPGFRWNEKGTVNYTNSAGLFHKSELIQRYDKVRLVPFGEYVPLGKLLFFVNRLVVAAGDFRPGDDLTPVRYRDAGIGILICYEAIFPEIARQYRKNGATILVNITNDAWFGRSPAPHQHFAMSRFRAVENECYLVRAANTGVTGIVAPWGEVIDRTGIFREASLKGRIFY